MTGTLPPESFRIYDRTDFFVVNISDTVDAMREAMRLYVGRCHPNQLACVIDAESPDIPGLVGVIYLPKDKLGSGLVAHELAHATFRLLERRDVKVRHWVVGRRARRFRWAFRLMPALYDLLAVDANPDEETYALTLEHLTRTFWNEAYAHGYA